MSLLWTWLFSLPFQTTTYFLCSPGQTVISLPQKTLVLNCLCLFVFLLSHMLLPCQFLEIIVRHSDKEKGNFSNIRIIIYDVSFSYTSELDLCNGHNVAYMPADPIASIYTCHIVLQFHCQNTRWQWSIWIVKTLCQKKQLEMATRKWQNW